MTGASRGIGRAIAEMLASRGYLVSALARTSSPELPNIRSIRCDLTREQSAAKAFAQARAAHGAIEILVNNAGMARSAPFAKTNRALWDLMLGINLTTAFVCSRFVIEEMQGAKYGRIVNVASTAGLSGAPYISAYCAAKHGVVGLTRALAAEFANSGITVNAVCPGYVETQMLEATLRTIAAKTGRSENAARAELARQNPGGRILSPLEVAAAVCDLIESEKNGEVVELPREVPA